MAGNAYLLTSYDATTIGSVVNQIQRKFDGLGQMTTEWQAVVTADNQHRPESAAGYSFAALGSTDHFLTGTSLTTTLAA